MKTTNLAVKNVLNVVLEGPIGYKLIVYKTTENVILVAEGIGITSFLPILEELVQDKQYKDNYKL